MSSLIAPTEVDGNDKSIERDYRHFALEIETAIRRGDLRPGERLLPQREFAWRNGIAVSTASRVYAEIRRRGLVNGEIGRGTFVLSCSERAQQSLPDEFVDLDRNFAILADQGQLLSRSLAKLVTPNALMLALMPAPASMLAHAQAVAAKFLKRDGWSPNPESIFCTGNGRESLSAAIALVSRPGDRIGIEATTYPVLKEIALRAGVELVPLAMDGEGLVPEAVVAVNRSVGLQAIYVQPTLHNPLGMSMSPTRLQALAEVLAQEELLSVEDAVNSFLAPGPLLATHAPTRTVVVESLSKRISPNLTMGFLVVPAALRGRAAMAVRETAWSAVGWNLAASIRLMKDGAATELEAAKRRDAAKRQGIARECLADLELEGDPRAYHLWIRLPKPWRAESFVSAAAGMGLLVTPGQAFTVGAGHGPNAIRITLGTPTEEVLRQALTDLRRLALEGHEAAEDGAPAEAGPGLPALTA